MEQARSEVLEAGCTPFNHYLRAGGSCTLKGIAEP